MCGDWMKVLDDDTIRFVILDPEGDGDMVRCFRAQPGWDVDFEDGEAVIFARPAEGNN